MMTAYLVCEGGDAFWYAFHAVPEGKLGAGNRTLPLTATERSSLSVIGFYPAEAFTDRRGRYAEDAATILPGGPEGWDCTAVRVDEAVCLEADAFGRLLVHALATFSYRRPVDGKEMDVRVEGNSRDGLRAYPPPDLSSLLG